jgi:CheY-like chemotaxis protein
MTSRVPLEELVPKLREANEQLVIASVRAAEMQDEALAANHRQNEFLSMLAHELRNPLAPIATAADVLEKLAFAHPDLPNIQRIIARQVGHMKRLLEDLLDVSRVTTGKITLVCKPVLLADIIRHAAEIAQPLIDSHRQSLTVDLPIQPVVIHGDAVRLAQVFSNLLINASKYSPESKPIAVVARTLADGRLAVSVKDTGVGIEPAMQPYIFDLFTQAPCTLDRSEGGLGIGLLMVRSLVQMHGGNVDVQSEGHGHGSTFTVVLPISGDVVSADLPAPHPALAGSSRILIIEDNVDGNETLNYCLSAEGHTVHSAFDGPQGLTLAKGGHYDYIFCDIGLPEMDGYEVVRQIRLQCFEPRPCCIAMTGYDNQEYRDRAHAAGFDDFLVKPVSMNQLLDTVAANHLRNGL